LTAKRSLDPVTTGERGGPISRPNLFRAEELNYRQVRALNPERTIAFLPVSALEVHGPHLPLGMDLFMARWTAEETGRRFAEAHPDWTVVVFLPLTLGTDEVALRGSMNGTARELYRVVMAHAGSLVQAGYRYVVVTNGHNGPRHASGLEAACRAASRRYGIAMFTPSIAIFLALLRGDRFQALESLLGRSLTPEERAGILSGDHAATVETSFVLAERPELVDPIYRELGPVSPPPFRPLVLLARPIVSLLGRGGNGERRQRLEEFVDGMAMSLGWLLNNRFGYGGPEVTYMGNPSVASVELGEAIRRLVVDDCLAVVEKVVRGELRPEEVRSTASDPIILHPLFLRRLTLAAVALAAVLLVLWERQHQRD
jgi:creatinine amidohydrolase/Fe(II)-dependent formamide hydrolase-like protein